jgi:hypothetical protein
MNIIQPATESCRSCFTSHRLELQGHSFDLSAVPQRRRAVSRGTVFSRSSLISTPSMLGFPLRTPYQGRCTWDRLVATREASEYSFPYQGSGAVLQAPGPGTLPGVRLGLPPARCRVRGKQTRPSPPVRHPWPSHYITVFSHFCLKVDRFVTESLQISASPA